MSRQERRILMSIYGMTQQILCQRTGKQSDLKKPVGSMERLIVQNCSPNYMVKKQTNKQKTVLRLFFKGINNIH